MCHLLLVLDLLLLHTVSGSKLHHITSSPISQCPTGESCLTLSMFAANTSSYLDLNTTLVLLAGNHILDSQLLVSNVDEFLIILSTNSSVTASITCRSNAILKFINITHMHIGRLEFIRCNTRVENLEHFTLEDSSFQSNNDDGSALHLIETSTKIVRTSFSNSMGSYQNHVSFLKF